MAEIVLPTAKAAVECVDPSTLALFGLPKCGKTTALSELDGVLDVDTEKGSGFVEIMKLKVPEELGPVAKFKWLKELAKKIKDAGRPYNYVAIDTFTMVDEWAEWVGTYNYMNSIAGCSFNRVGGEKNGEKLKPDHPDYESVHNLGQGYGYRWSREAVTDMYETLKDIGRICTIFVCHTADKAVVSRVTNQEVATRDLALTGKVRDIIARRVDAIGYVYNEEGKIMVSFKGSEHRVGGIRAKHIQGYEGPLDWSKIFIENKK